MGHLERSEVDQSGGTAAPLRVTDVMTRDDRIPPEQIKSANATDSAGLANKGDIPQVLVDASSADSKLGPTANAEESANKRLSDILPSVDLEMIRNDRAAGGTTTEFKYMESKTAPKDVPGGLSAADRETSIFYKIETGQVDGSKIFKNASELFKTSSTGTAGDRPGDVTPRQQVPRDLTPKKPGDEGVPREPQTEPGRDGTVQVGNEVRPGEVPPGGDQQPAPYRSARLELNADGSAKVPVKQGDTMWGIAKETLRHGREPGYQPTDTEVANAVNRLARENPQIRNRNVIKEGRDTIKIPKDMIREIPPQVAPSDGPKITVENRGASDAFKDKMQAEVDKLPGGVRRLLEANGTKIVVGEKMSGVYPELAGVRPRGWPPGSTWDNTDGMYNPTDKTAVVTERRVDNGTSVPNERAEGVIKHEVGHAVDHAMGNFSQSDEFKQAYDRDVAALSPADKARLQYLLQPGDAGKSETFAEVFGAVNGASANPSETRDTLRQFPSIAALLQRKIAAM